MPNSRLPMPNSLFPWRFLTYIGIFLTSWLSLWVNDLKAFPDLTNYWAASCISEMQPRKLVTGCPDGSFRPNNTITRAEFAVLMLNAFPDAAIIRSGITTFLPFSLCLYLGILGLPKYFSGCFFQSFNAARQPCQDSETLLTICLLTFVGKYRYASKFLVW